MFEIKYTHLNLLFTMRVIPRQITHFYGMPGGGLQISSIFDVTHKNTTGSGSRS